MKFILSIFLIFSSSFSVYAADHTDQWYFMWGYNNAVYDDSDIHFKGDDYDFTLHDVSGSDRPSKIKAEYLFHVTKPQINARFGYYFDKTHRISFGNDHMKYIADPGQTVKMTGTDHQGNVGDGTSATEQQIEKNYLEFEHTDGLNFVNVGLETLDPFLKTKKYELYTFYGIDLGVVLPRSDVTLGANKRNNKFNLVGYGTALKVGVILDIGDSWFAQFTLKQGSLWMPDIRTTSSSSDTASQSINFFQGYFALAYFFN